MDKSEKEALKKELKDIAEWMRDAADIYYKDYPLEEMQKDCGDAYEVICTIYLNNGRKIEVRNHCARNYVFGNYDGDDLDVDDNGVNIEIYHDRERSTHFYYIPYSSISYIKSYSDDSIWHKGKIYDLYKQALERDKAEAEAKAKQESEHPTQPQGDMPHFDYVYCRGTEDGKGVIEALEAHGGKNVYNHDGTNSCYDYTYYIDPDGEIVSFIPDQDADRFILVKQFYTEVQPLTN